MFGNVVLGLAVALIAILVPPTPVQSTQTYEATTTPQVIDIDDLITKDAAKYGISRRILDSVIACESDYNVHAISPTGDYGIAQLNLKAWGFTEAQAFDPVFSIDFMAHEFSLGGAHYWVCYQKLYM